MAANQNKEILGVNDMAANQNKESLGVNEIIKPSLSVAEAEGLIMKLYGLEVTKIKPLVSYDDLNFHVMVKFPPTALNKNVKIIAKGGYVFKVLNSKDSLIPDLVNGQNEMMIFCNENGYNCNKPVQNIEGNYISELSLGGDQEKKKHLCRLLTFAEGTVLASVAMTDTIFRGMGSYLAHMQVSLQKFKNSYLQKRKFIWMQSNTPDVRAFQHAVTDCHRAALADAAYQAWETTVLPVFQSLPAGFVHGDFNEQNVLVDMKDGNFKISGVIDFGDVSWSPYVSDLAICIVSVLTTGNTVKEVGAVLQGYCSVRQLDATEWHVLYESIMARLYTSLVMGAYSHSLDPTNSYLLTTAKQGWRALQDLIELDKTQLLKMWKDSIPVHRKD